MCHLYFWTIVNSYEGANTLIHWQLKLSLKEGGGGETCQYSKEFNKILRTFNFGEKNEEMKWKRKIKERRKKEENNMCKGLFFL